MTLAVRSYDSRWSHSRSLQPTVRGLNLFDRLWWHTKALVPVVGIVFLVLGSLAFLHLHWMYRALLKVSGDQNLANARHLQ